MDPYDAIIEQLNKAQQRGVEAVTNRLDFVLESLEGMLQEAREAVQEAIPTDAEELFPVIEVSEAAERARDIVAALEARVQELEASVEGIGERPPEGVSLGLLRRLDAARSQSELLRGLLPMLLDHVGRAAVLVVRDRTVSAWSGIGFSDGERLRDWRADADESETLRRLVDDAAVVGFAPAADPVFSEWLHGEAEALEGMLVPVSLHGRVVGAFYVDRLDGGPWAPETVQGLVALACWLIDTLSLRTTVPSPMLGEPVWVGGPVEAAAFEEAVAPEEAAPPELETPVAEEEAAPAAEEEVVPAVEGEAAAEAEAPIGGDEVTPEAGYPPVTAEEPEAAAEDEWARREEPEPAPEREWAPPEEPAESVAAPPEAPAAEAEFEEETEERMPAGFDPSATMRVDTGPAIERVRAEMEVESAADEVEAEVEAPAPGPVEAAPPEAGAVVPPPVAPYTPPPVQPIVPPPPVEEAEPAAGLPVSALSPEEQSQHEEAQRFARLLVSEIKLYNPDEVEKGRSNQDLYRRLKEDIERSREMYERRVAEEVRSVHDYFQDELVRILADGDEDALGM